MLINGSTALSIPNTLDTVIVESLKLNDYLPKHEIDSQIYDFVISIFKETKYTTLSKNEIDVQNNSRIIQ